MTLLELFETVDAVIKANKAASVNKRKEVTKVINEDELPERLRKYFATTEAGVPQRVAVGKFIVSHSVWRVNI